MHPRQLPYLVCPEMVYMQERDPFARGFGLQHRPPEDCARLEYGEPAECQDEGDVLCIKG